MSNKSFKQKLANMIKNFAEKGIVFSNEQDFQFEMALALKDSKEFPEVLDVKLESVSLDIPWSNVIKCAKNNENITQDHKEYHDILVKIKDGDKNKNIAIELKYKCPYRICYYMIGGNEMVTFRQGAYDEGAYGFIKDISRLENINHRYKANNVKVDVCYAIMLTNDWNYRDNDFSRTRLNKHSPYMNYSIKHGKQLKSGTLKFVDTDDPNEYKGKNAIHLLKDYNLIWETYGLPKSGCWNDKKSYMPDFSFLIVEVKPQ